MAKIAIGYTLIRPEEKLIIEAAKKRNAEIKLLHLEKEILDEEKFPLDFEIYLDRSISTIKGLYVLQFLENCGKKVINESKVAKTCQDKFLTSVTLQKFNIPQPKFTLAFSLEQAKKAVEILGGLPVVLKSPFGSWGRLLAKISDWETLEAIIEHREFLGSAFHKVYYLQKYVEKNGRDIRAFVFDDEVLCAIYRNSLHWITNTARGGKATDCKITEELRKICQKTSKAIGGGILGIDLFETKEGFLVNEVNHVIEFRNSEMVTGVSISLKIIDYCLEKLKKYD